MGRGGEHTCAVVRSGRAATLSRVGRSNPLVQAVSTPLGRITIASEAIAQIVGETARECYGVVAMAGPKWLPERARKGIEITRAGEEVTIDLHVVVEYGLNLAEVASSIRNRVSYEVERMTGLRVRAVEVHVDGVRRSA